MSTSTDTPSFLERHKALFAGAALALVCGALIMIVRQPGSTAVVMPTVPTRSYFTTDDASAEGAKASLFVDSVDRLPPFERGGKQAYRAVVFSDDGGSTSFVGYLERLTPEAKQQLERAMAADPKASSLMLRLRLPSGSVEYKRPGDDKWSSGEPDVLVPPGMDRSKMVSIDP